MIEPLKNAASISRMDVARLRAMGQRLWTAAELAEAFCMTPAAARSWASKMGRANVVNWDGKTAALNEDDPTCPAPAGPRPPRPKCFGECGTWRRPTAEDRKAGALAVGPSIAIYDGEGRAYEARYELRCSRHVQPSNDPESFSATRGYPPALQARDRGGATARKQVLDLSKTLDVLRLLAPASGVAEGTPVVWRKWVVSGNGRAMAVARWMAAPGNRERYVEAARRRWNTARVLQQALERSDCAQVVRVLLDDDESSAVRLAGASQQSSSGELSTLERAAGRARGLGVTSPSALGAFEWFEPIGPAEWSRFRARNRAWVAQLLERVDPARRASLDAPEAGSELVTDILIGGLSADVVANGLGDPLGQAAMIGALPGIYTLESLAAAGEVFDAWRLLDRLPEARAWVGKVGGEAISRIGALVDVSDRQTDLFQAETVSAQGADRLAVALAVGLIRAGRRANPQAAAAGYIKAYAARALEFDPRAGSLFGSPSKGDPAAELAKIVRVTLTGGRK